MLAILAMVSQVRSSPVIRHIFETNSFGTGFF